MGHSHAVARERHRQVTALHSRGLAQNEIRDILGLSRTVVSKHILNNCRCGSSEYVYVPASWFKCRLCDGGWFERNGCQHSWELVL